MKHAIALVACAFGFSTPDVWAQRVEQAVRLRVILVGDTDGRNAEQLGMAKDVETFSNLFKEALKGRKDQLTLSVLIGPDVTPSKVFQTLRELRPSKDDAVFFFYSGHGAMSKYGHFFATKRGRIYRADVINTLLDYRSFNTVVFADCCADFVEAPRLEKRAIAKWSVLKELFFENHGFTDVFSSGEGTSSLGTKDGGLCAIAFSRLLCQGRKEIYQAAEREPKDYLDWDSFYKAVWNNTIALSGKRQFPVCYDHSRHFKQDKSKWRNWYRGRVQFSNNTDERVTIEVNYRLDPPIQFKEEDKWQDRWIKYTFGSRQSDFLWDDDHLMRAWRVKVKVNNLPVFESEGLGYTSRLTWDGKSISQRHFDDGESIPTPAKSDGGVSSKKSP